MMLAGLITGRKVHYVNSELEHLSATICKVVDHPRAVVNLQVQRPDADGSELKKDVKFCGPNRKTPDTWHWIERVGGDGKEQSPKD